MSMYAIIPKEQWLGEVAGQFPHAPLVKNYRVLVFADAETESLKSDYADRGMVELTSFSEIIEHINSGLKPWVILQVEPLREVMQQFNPPSDEVI